MRRVVLDPVAFLEWFGDGSRTLRAEYESGALAVVVPSLFPAHLLEVMAARADMTRERLAAVAQHVERIGFVRREPAVALVAQRVGAGWPMLPAQYAALAEELEVPLVAGDPELRRRGAALLLRT